MTPRQVSFTVAVLALLPFRAAAQDVPPAIRTAAACAPLGARASSRAPRVVPPPSVVKTRFTVGEVVNLDRGASDELQAGERYMIYRPMRFEGAPRAQYAIGWLRVTDATDASATARIEFACDAVAVGDWIEPFTQLALPVDVARSVAGGSLDFQHAVRVSYGTDGRSLFGDRDFVLADGGQNTGVTAGGRYAAFRRGTSRETTDTPVAEAVVVAVFAEQSLLRVTEARAPLFTGDQMILRVGAMDPPAAMVPTRPAVVDVDSRPEPAESAATVTAAASADARATRPADHRVTFDDIAFGLDRHSLRPEARARLDEAVAMLRSDPALRVQVEGHTCSIGTAEYNLTLGQRRADAVRAYLVGKGVPAHRLTTVSHGEEKPAHDNADAEGRRLNRRAVLVVSFQR